MKALFASFGRRSAAHNNNHNDSSPSKSSKSARSNGLALNGGEKPSRSFGGAGDSIGAAPTSLQHREKWSAAKSEDWSARLTGTFRGSSKKKRDKGGLPSDDGGGDTAANAMAAPPPSSYRDPGVRRPSSPGFHAIGPSSNHLSPPVVGNGSQPASRSNSLKLKPSVSPASEHERTLAKDARYPPSASRSSFISRSGREGGSDDHGRRSTNSKRASLTLSNTQAARSTDGHTAGTASKRASMTSEDLATKLSELAVANGDGLLSDEEFRTLRQGLFDKMMQLDGESMQVPQERNLDGLGATTSTARSVNGLDEHANFADSKSSIANGEGMSMHSNRNARNSTLGSMSGFFKRGGVGANSMRKELSGDSGSGLEDAEASLTKPKPRRRGSASASSLLSSGDGHSLRPPSSMTHHSNAARSSRASTMSRLRAGSMGRRMQAEALAADMERTYSQARSARSLRATSIHEASFIAPEDSSDAGEKSSAEMRAEIAVVQAEGARLLDTFEGMETTIISKYNLEPSLLKKAVEEVKLSRHAPPSSYRPPRGHEDEAESLKRELMELGEKREAVVKRYEERLALLRSKLRSATIKEGLNK